MYPDDPTQPQAPTFDQSTQAPTSGPNAPATGADPNDPRAVMQRALLARMLMGGSVNPGMVLGMALSQGLQGGGGMSKGGGQPAAPPAGAPPMMGNFPPSDTA